MASWDYEAEVQADSPLHWWKLNETSGTNAVDDGSAGEDGTYAGTAAERLINQEPIIWGANPGPQGRAVLWNADGTPVDDGHMVRAAPTMPTTDIALELWLEDILDWTTVMLLSYVIGGPVIEFGFELQQSFQLTTHIKGTTVLHSTYSPMSFTDKDAHHFYVDWTDAGVVRTFINGLQVAETTGIQVGQTLTAGGDLMLAQDQSAPGVVGAAADAYEGRMDQVAIYSAPLSDDRIRAHASAGRIRYLPTVDHPLAMTVSEFAMSGASSVVTNRVWDLIAAGFIRWDTASPDSTGVEYPGPDVFGSTLDYCVEAST